MTAEKYLKSIGLENAIGEEFFCNDERSKEGKCPEQCGVCSEYASI
jgi:hypothetical protein